MELFITVLIVTTVLMIVAESYKRWSAFILTGLLILSGILFLLYSYFQFGVSDTAWYVVFMILVLIPLVPLSIFSTLIGRWFKARYHKQKQGL